MRAPNAVGFAALGAGLIAVTYGLARYAFGLFVPAMRSELGLSPEAVGIVGAMAFVSFALASGLAPLTAARLGARHAAMVASAFAVTGLALISRASDALTLGAGVFACGIATGLMMPALSAGVEAAVERRLHGRVNAVMNAGTSLGLVACVVPVLIAIDAWRAAYVAFAALALAGLVAVWLALPAVARADHGDAGSPARRGSSFELGRLAVLGFAIGFVGSGYWIFAPDLVVSLGGAVGRTTAVLWLIVGLAGLAGAWASDLGDRLGGRSTHALALTAMASAFALLAASPERVVVTWVSAAVFGWSFMTLSGLYLVHGIRLLPGRAEWGPVLPFLAIAVGQAAGSPAIGWAIDRVGYADAFVGCALLGLLIAAASPLFPASPHISVAAPKAPPASSPQRADGSRINRRARYRGLRWVVDTGGTPSAEFAWLSPLAPRRAGQDRAANPRAIKWGPTSLHTSRLESASLRCRAHHAQRCPKVERARSWGGLAKPHGSAHR